jgi:YbgC/YbaW family acyl-CoA thioester hydrolase
VTWHDTDASGRIHFTSVFLWAEQTEIALWRAQGIDPKEAIDYPRRRVEAEYLRPLSFDDEVEVQMSVARVGTTSVTFDWQIFRDGELAVRGSHTVVHVDASGGPGPLTDGTRQRLASIAIQGKGQQHA